jgi:hypothetical protein
LLVAFCFFQLSGHGLALAGAGIEQDAAYWEWHINKAPEGSKIMFGVAHRKDRKFYNELDKSKEGGFLFSKCIVLFMDSV